HGRSTSSPSRRRRDSPRSSLTSRAPPPTTTSSRNCPMFPWRSDPQRTDRALVWVLRACAAASGVIVGLIAVLLVAESVPVLRHAGVSAFFTDPGWHPGDGQYNLTPMLVGSLLAMAGSVVVATPIGVLSAIFCHFYAPPFVARLYRRLIE